jgi:hypothetical protein
MPPCPSSSPLFRHSLKEGLALTRPTGPALNKMYGIDAKTGRYRETGDWFGRIAEFPATLWNGPPYGYVRFETEDALKSCPGLTVHPAQMGSNFAAPPRLTKGQSIPWQCPARATFPRFLEEKFSGV